MLARRREPARDEAGDAGATDLEWGCIESRMYDADGKLTANPALAARGEVVVISADGSRVRRLDRLGWVTIQPAARHDRRSSVLRSVFALAHRAHRGRERAAPDLRELIGEDVPVEEQARLGRVHELLLAAGRRQEVPVRGTRSPAAAGADATDSSSHRLRIAVPGEQAGLALVEAIKELHAELAPDVSGACCTVVVELPDTDDAERAAADVLATLAHWLAATGVAATRVELAGRSFTVRASADDPRRPTNVDRPAA